MGHPEAVADLGAAWWGICCWRGTGAQAAGSGGVAGGKGPLRDRRESRKSTYMERKSIAVMMKTTSGGKYA